jgi:hypothetical protein
MQLRLIAAAGLLAGSLFAADPGLLDLAMADARVMAGINVEQARTSPFGQYVLARMQEHESELLRLAEATGFDPRRDLREVLLASTGEPGSHTGVVLARGVFDPGRIVEAARSQGKTIDTYRGVAVIRGGEGKHGSLAFPDSTLAVAGDDASVRAAIDRKGEPSAIGADLAVQVSQLSTTQDAWFVSLVPPNQLRPHPAEAGGPPPGAFGTLSKVQQASGGVKLGANMVLSARAVSQTEKDAAALADVVKMLADLAQMNAPQGQPAAAAALLQNLAVTAEGAVTTLSLSIPEQQLEQLIGGGRQRRMRPAAERQ